METFIVASPIVEKLTPSSRSFADDRLLQMERAKRRSLLISLAYRIKRIGQAFLGTKTILRFCLNMAWLCRRFAHEMSCEEFGATYQQSALALSEDLLMDLIPANNGTVIDIGCGTGRWCRVAARYAHKVVGVDLNSENIARAKKNTDESNIEYIVADITLDLTEVKFDLGLLIHVLEHIDDVDGLLQAIRQRVTTLVVEVPDIESDSLNWTRLKIQSPFYTDSDHVREYTAELLELHLKRGGWEVSYRHKYGGAVLIVAVQNNE